MSWRFRAKSQREGNDSVTKAAVLYVFRCRAAGETIALKGRDEIAVEAGDEILIATPGGGGYGTR